MRIIKLAIISIVVFFLLATAMTSLLPSTIIISRAKDINANPGTAYQYVTNVATWQYWLHTGDTTTMLQVINEKEVHYNSTIITITGLQKNQITSTWQTGNSDPMVAKFNFITGEGSNTFTLQWEFTQKVKWYPWEKLASIVSDKAIGPFMEKSLDNLAKRLEQASVDQQ